MPRGETVSDQQLLDAVDAAIADGAVDLLEGGVPPEEVADRVDLSVRCAEDRLRALVQAGHLRRVQGADPETYQSRVSYRPVDREETSDP